MARVAGPHRFVEIGRPPPVRIGRANARALQSSMVADAGARFAMAAGDYGQKERRNASVPIRLRIQKSAGPNSPIATSSVKAIGHTRRKRGYPPVTELP